jgi:hypothetical protein
MDFALDPEGNVLLFEANATMVQLPPHPKIRSGITAALPSKMR